MSCDLGAGVDGLRGPDGGRRHRDRSREARSGWCPMLREGTFCSSAVAVLFRRCPERKKFDRLAAADGYSCCSEMVVNAGVRRNE